MELIEDVLWFAVASIAAFFFIYGTVLWCWSVKIKNELKDKK